MRRKKLKIAILTIVDYSNYGNRLQNYALQTLLQNMGHEVLTVKNFFGNDGSFTGKIMKMLNLGKAINKMKYHQIDSERHSNFLNFTHRYITESKKSYYHLDDDFSEFKDVDCFVIGSDQVWNYNFPHFSELSFASFTNKPRFSYAASFGVDNIPENLKTKFATNLQSIDDISVREEVGKVLVDKLTDKKATVVLDPTLLLDCGDWLELTKNLTTYKRKYLLTYFLSKPEQATIDYINKYATQHNLQIKNLAFRGDKEMWVSNPAEFVNLFAQAEKVYTDSFHACAFSIIFKKDFEVFERTGTNGAMNSRITTLLGKLELEDRWYVDSGATKEKINYNRVDNLLCEQRKQSMDFLNQALENVKCKM